jgi:predicted GNAT family N-acyltransferase
LNAQICTFHFNSQNITMHLQIKIADFNSNEQTQSIELRRQILRLPLGLDFSNEELQNEFNQVHIVAIFDNHVIGVLLLVKDKENKLLKMRQVAVDSNFQSKGIGQKMVFFSENWAAKNQYKVIELHARISAVEFYKKMNYEALGNEFIEVGIPHLKMKKILAF